MRQTLKPGRKKISRRCLLTPLLSASLLLAGCQDQTIQTAQPLRPGDYAAILPYETSNTRAKHIGLLTDVDIRTQLEQGLMDLSKEYFSPDEVAFKNHAFLDYDELDASDGSRGLLGTLRDNNPNGLNPSADEDFDTGNGIVKGPILVADLYEVDFYTGNELKGISIGLAVNDAVEQEGKRIEITPEKMQEYLRATGTKIVTYMRERFNEVGYDVPILIAAYELNTDENDNSKGGYVFTDLFEGSKTSEQVISEDYMLVPSTAFSQAQPEMAEQFETFRQDVAQILSDSTYTTGQAKIENGSVQRLTLTVTAHGKTVGEILAVIQSVCEHLSLFTSQNCAYKVIIKNNGDICALMDREAKTDKVEVLTVY